MMTLMEEEEEEEQDDNESSSSSSQSMDLITKMSKNGGQIIKNVEWSKKCVKEQKKHEELSQVNEDALDFDELTSKLQTKLLYYMTLGLDKVEIQALMKHDLNIHDRCCSDDDKSGKSCSGKSRQVEKMIGKLVDSDHAIAVHWLRTTELVKVYRARALDYEPSLSEFLGTTGGSSTVQKKQQKQNSNNRPGRDDNGSGSGRKTMSKKSESSGDGDDQKKKEKKEKEKDGKDGSKKSSSSSGKDNKDKSKDEKRKKFVKKLDLDDLEDKDDLMKREVWFKRVKGGYQLYARGSLANSDDDDGDEEIFMRTTNYKWIVDHVVKGNENSAPEYVKGVVDSVGREKDRLTLGIKYQDSV